MKKPVVLMILDGFGLSEQETGNALKMAELKNFHHLLSTCPNNRIEAGGMAVGLPEGQMGNSEVGHLNIGAGRIVYQELTRINKSIQDGDFFTNPVLTDAVKNAKKNGTLHLMGLVSDGGVHSHIDHLFALLEMAHKHQLKEVAVHCFLDGRDTPPQSAIEFIRSLEQKISELDTGVIRTVAGRYYAMDRDQRWERVKLAYDALVLGEGRTADTAEQAVKESYDRDENDEFVKPTIITGNTSDNHLIKPDDSVIFFNFRPDRAREMTRALMDETFKGFERPHGKFPLYYVTMTEYDKNFEGPRVAYPPQSIVNTLGETVSRQGRTQLRIAETEKYAHVTYFLNGGVEVAFEGEDRIMIPSSKVATYDMKPEMKAYEVTDALLSRLEKNDLDLVVINYANADMVGHTGVIDAVVKAVEVVDECMGKVVDKVKQMGGALLVTSDHGNAEELLNEATGAPVTSHSTNPVPLILVGMDEYGLKSGGLSDLAPTLLDMMDLKQPDEMTGHSLLVK